MIILIASSFPSIDFLHLRTETIDVLEILCEQRDRRFLNRRAGSSTLLAGQVISFGRASLMRATRTDGLAYRKPELKEVLRIIKMLS
jgi:hypothetical protein